MTTTRRPTGSCDRSRAWRSSAMKSAEEHRVVAAEQRIERHVATELRATADLDAADRQQPRDLLLREVVDGLVGRDAVLVEAAELRPGVEQHHVVPTPRQPVRAGQARRSAADDGDALAGGGSAREQRRARPGEVDVGGVPLQLADLDRLRVLAVAHARLLAQHLGGTDPRAHAPERIGLEDAARGAALVALRDALDEARDVDAGGAGRDAGRVVAVVAALGFDLGLRPRQRRMRIGEVAGIGIGREPSRDEAGLAVRLGGGSGGFDGCHGVPFSSSDDRPCSGIDG